MARKKAKDKILEIIQEKMEYYKKLSETQNGFEMACKGGVQACKDIIKEIEDKIK